MKSLLHESDRETLRRRFGALRPDTTPRWGKFTAPQMAAHLIQSMRVMLGEVPMPAEPTPWIVRNPPLKHLLIYVLPFPKGLPTSPVLLERAAHAGEAADAAGWQEEIRAFGEALDAIAARDPAAPWPTHAAFGPLSGREWGVLQFRHLDHHFRQFGL
jgi:hypothetical protein